MMVLLMVTPGTSETYTKWGGGRLCPTSSKMTTVLWTKWVLNNYQAVGQFEAELHGSGLKPWQRSEDPKRVLTAVVSTHPKKIWVKWDYHPNWFVQNNISSLIDHDTPDNLQNVQDSTASEASTGVSYSLSDCSTNRNQWRDLRSSGLWPKDLQTCDSLIISS